MGDWYWNGGVQKSQENFKSLVDLISRPDFSPSDISRTRWSEIDASLATGRDDDTDPAEWLDEDNGWKHTAISIHVPFHRRMKNPGSQVYVVGELYHRPIMSVIRERLTNPDHEQFYYEPYELFWKPKDDQEDVRVYGEMYTSEAFLDAQRELLQSSPEPGCNASRVIVALMFWSDATHLTSFGNAKLWPCYMFFGNDSKYRRCQPTSNLCNHIAYFQAVRSFMTHNYLLRF